MIGLAVGARLAVGVACGAPQVGTPGGAPAPPAAPAAQKPAAPAAQPAAPAGPPAAPGAQPTAAAAKGQFENETVHPVPFKQGGTLRLAHSDASLHLDPVSSISHTTHKRLSLIYQHLLAMHPDPKDSRETIFEPQVAERWDVSPDGREVTFYLRKDIRWASDPDGLLKGRQLTAQDVLYSVQQWRSEQAPKAPLYKNITDARALDDFTVKFTFDKASPQNLPVLASEPAWIMPREPKEKYGDLKTWGYGFGPYNITKHDPNTVTVWERNPTYYDAAKVGPDRIEVVIVRDKATAVAAFRSGQIDSIGNNQHLDVIITAEDAREIKRTNPEVAQVDFPRMGVSAVLAIRANCQCPLDDLRVRKALAHAIDRDALIAAVQQGDGYWTDIFPSPAYPTFATPEAKLREWFKYDPELSKKLLAEAGQANGFTVQVLWNRDDATRRKLLDLEVQMLGKLGIKLDTQTLAKDYPSFTPDAFAGRYPHLSQWGYVGSTVWNFLDCIVYVNGCRNGTRMNDPKVNAAIDRIFYELKEDQRPAEVQKLSEYLFTEALYVQPLFNDYNHWLIQPWVKNLRIERGGDAAGVYHLDEFAYVSIQR